ncbi:hypothetical protein ACN47E_006136 [Coniothyrium glycines]
MAETPVESPRDLTRRQHALVDSQFASVADDDLTASEDDTPDEQLLELETVQSAIGVSIGQQQTRLTSPKTPAAEKAAALEATEDGLFFDGWDQTPGTGADATADSPSRSDTRRALGPATPLAAEAQSEVEGDSEGEVASELSTAPTTRLPSPWRAGPKTFNEKVSDHRPVLRQHLQGHRGRASSNGFMTDAMRKYMPFSLPSSISKSYKDIHFSLPSFSALSLEPERSRQAASAADRQRRKTFASGLRLASIPQHDGGMQSTHQQETGSQDPAIGTSQTPHTAPLVQREFSDDSASTLPVQLPRHSRDRPAPRLRRSNSEGSLMVYRTISLASSLGDDSRFESVQEMTNSRLKALKDSWQDSNFKLPSPSFPNFNFGNRDDVFKSRNSSTAQRDRESSDSATHRVSFKPTIPTSSSRRLSTKPKQPTAKDSVTDGETHPHFAQALQELEGDLVVLGGYRGSVLRSAEPPNRQLWVPIKVGLNLRKVDLEVPLDPDADARMEETIIPSGMLTHIGPVDISRRLFKRLKASDNARDGKLRVHNYGYDWRLSPHFLSRRMISFLESLPCNQPGVAPEKRGAYVVAHSLGGLVVRHAINERPDLVAGIVYAGVPQRCVNILGPFRNGDDVLLSSRVLTAQVNFSIRTSYALLPLDGKCFINKETKEEYPVDFFDVNTWIEHRLSPCLAAPLPRPEQPKDSTFSVSGLMNAMSSALPSFPNRKSSSSLSKSPQGGSTSTNDTSKDIGDTVHKAVDKLAEGGASSAGMEPHMNQGQQNETSKEPNPATDITIPYDKAVEYLTRTLAEVKRFKLELAHKPEHTATNAYPPGALIYGKSTPTVVGAKVESREAIKRADVYDELAFASGDGVVLARAAMMPEGYAVVRGGVVSSDRGHVTLLGDLEAVGKCLHAVIQARRSGVGLGEARSHATKREVIG